MVGKEEILKVEPPKTAANTIRFKVVKQETEVEVEIGSVAYERMIKTPTEYAPLSPIPKEPDKPPIIDGDAKGKK